MKRINAVTLATIGLFIAKTATAMDLNRDPVLQQAESSETNVEPSPLAPPPELTVIDDVGINIISGMPVHQLQDLSIGSGNLKLTHTIASYDAKFWGLYDDFRTSFFNSSPAQGYTTATIGHRSQIFENLANGQYQAFNRDGASLVKLADGSFVYTAADGMQYFQNESRILYPNGFEIIIHRTELSPYTDQWGEQQFRKRTQSVTTNTGLQFKYEYATDIYTVVPSCPEPPYEGVTCHDHQREFYFPSHIVALNNTVDYCDPVANSCAFSQPWPTVNYDWPLGKDMFATHHTAPNVKGVFTITHVDSTTTQYSHERFGIKGPNGQHIQDLYGWKHVTRLTEVKSRTSTGALTETYTYKDFVQRFPHDQQGIVFLKVRNMLIDTATRNGFIWTYDHTQPTNEYRMTGESIGPRGSHNAVMAKYGILDIKDQIRAPGLTLDYDENNPENHIKSSAIHGKQTQFEVNARGNTIKRTQVSTDGTTSSIEMADYDISCDNIKTCNKPNWVQDAKGNRTDYTYHEDSGYVSTITQPANSEGIRPQIRNFYERLYAFYKDASGTIVRGRSPVWVLTKQSTCLTGTAQGNGCALPDDEVTTEYEYGPAGQARNLWVKGITVTSTNGVKQRTCYQYDAYGNRIGETKPKAGLSVCSF